MRRSLARASFAILHSAGCCWRKTTFYDRAQKAKQTRSLCLRKYLLLTARGTDCVRCLRVLRDVHYAAFVLPQKEKGWIPNWRSLALKLVSPAQEKEINKFVPRVVRIPSVFVSCYWITCKIRRKIEFSRFFLKSGACRANSSTHTHTHNHIPNSPALCQECIYTNWGWRLWWWRADRVNSNSGYESSTSFLRTCHVSCSAMLNFWLLQISFNFIILC